MIGVSHPPRPEFFDVRDPRPSRHLRLRDAVRAFRTSGLGADAAARGDHRRLPAPGNRMPVAAGRGGAPAGRASRAGRAHRAGPDRGAARQAQGHGRRRAGARILAVEPGGRRPHVPRRGAPAHSRHRDARRPHPRQDRGRGLEVACRLRPLALRQCRDLGSRRHRQADDDGQRPHAVGRADAPHRAGRRAGDPARRRHGDAHDGRAVRHRRDDRGGAEALEAARGAGLPLFLRHARRGRDDGRRRPALLSRLRERYPCDRQGVGRARRRRGAGHLDQAVGAAPALRARAGEPRHGRASAAREGAGLDRRRYDIGLNIDAEEADRLELSLDLLEALALDPALKDWNGLGFVVQAYGKRCPS